MCIALFILVIWVQTAYGQMEIIYYRYQHKDPSIETIFNWAQEQLLAILCQEVCMKSCIIITICQQISDNKWKVTWPGNGEYNHNCPRHMHTRRLLLNWNPP